MPGLAAARLLLPEEAGFRVARGRQDPPMQLPPERHPLPEEAGFQLARHRKVTTWPLVQVPPGLNVVAVVPEVIPFSWAQRMAL